MDGCLPVTPFGVVGNMTQCACGNTMCSVATGHQSIWKQCCACRVGNHDAYDFNAFGDNVEDVDELWSMSAMEILVHIRSHPDMQFRVVGYAPDGTDNLNCYTCYRVFTLDELKTRAHKEIDE